MTFKLASFEALRDSERIQKNADNPDDMIQSVVDSIVNNAKILDNIKVWLIFRRRFGTQYISSDVSYSVINETGDKWITIAYHNYCN